MITIWPDLAECFFPFWHQVGARDITIFLFTAKPRTRFLFNCTLEKFCLVSFVHIRSAKQTSVTSTGISRIFKNLQEMNAKLILNLITVKT